MQQHGRVSHCNSWMRHAMKRTWATKLVQQCPSHWTTRIEANKLAQKFWGTFNYCPSFLLLQLFTKLYLNFLGLAFSTLSTGDLLQLPHLPLVCINPGSIDSSQDTSFKQHPSSIHGHSQTISGFLVYLKWLCPCQQWVFHFKCFKTICTIKLLDLCGHGRPVTKYVKQPL